MSRYQEIVIVPAVTYVELSKGDVLGALAFVPLDGSIEVRRGGASAPEVSAKGWPYSTKFGFRGTLADVSSDISGYRLWGRSLTNTAQEVMVDHA